MIVRLTTFDSMITIAQSVAMLIDGNNIEMSIHKLMDNKNAMLNFNTVIEKLLDGRSLNRLIYFREGESISRKLSERLLDNYHGSVVACHKSADIPLTIQAIQLAEKVDTIIILSGDSDYVDLVLHLKSRGVRVEIAAIQASTASILKNEADYYTTIEKEDCFIYNAPAHPQQKQQTVLPKKVISQQPQQQHVLPKKPAYRPEREITAPIQPHQPVTETQKPAPHHPKRKWRKPQGKK